MILKKIILIFNINNKDYDKEKGFAKIILNNNIE